MVIFAMRPYGEKFVFSITAHHVMLEYHYASHMRIVLLSLCLKFRGIFEYLPVPGKPKYHPNF